MCNSLICCKCSQQNCSAPNLHIELSNSVLELESFFSSYTKEDKKGRRVNGNLALQGLLSKGKLWVPVPAESGQGVTHLYLETNDKRDSLRLQFLQRKRMVEMNHPKLA